MIKKIFCCRSVCLQHALNISHYCVVNFKGWACNGDLLSSVIDQASPTVISNLRLVDALFSLPIKHLTLIVDHFFSFRPRGDMEQVTVDKKIDCVKTRKRDISRRSLQSTPCKRLRSEIFETSGATKSQLETLPNELFLEIFGYLTLEDLCSFKGLNRRIDAIIHDVKFGFNLQNEQTTKKWLSIFSPLQVIRFETNLRCFELFHTMENLRSLTLHCAIVVDSRWDGVRCRMGFQWTRMLFSTFSGWNICISRIWNDLSWAMPRQIRRNLYWESLQPINSAHHSLACQWK